VPRKGSVPPPVCLGRKLEAYETKVRLRLWTDWRAAVVDSLTAIIPPSRYGELAKRQALFNTMSEKLALKCSCRARLEEHEDTCATGTVVPATLENQDAD
jgi:hypothetical protein